MAGSSKIIKEKRHDTNYMLSSVKCELCNRDLSFDVETGGMTIYPCKFCFPEYWAKPPMENRMYWHKSYYDQIQECKKTGNRFWIDADEFNQPSVIACVLFKTYCNSSTCFEKRKKEGKERKRKPNLKILKT